MSTLSLYFSGFGLGRVCSRGKLEYTSDTGALTSLLSLGTCTPCLSRLSGGLDTLSRFGVVWLSGLLARKERQTLNVIDSSSPTSHFIVVDATIQTNDLIYRF